MNRAKRQSTNQGMLIDAHVHLYDCHDPRAFLDAAAANFQAAAESMGWSPDAPGVLLFAETSRDDRFAELLACAERDETIGPWRLQRTSEPISLLAGRDGQTTLALVAGRQIVTAENLEMLALCTDNKFDDGQAIAHTIEAIHQADGLAVLPFGVGKWRGRRGGMARDVLQSAANHNGSMVLAGDNRNRLAWLPRPALLEQAVQRGRWILPGSDPLPMPGQADFAGSFGLAINAPLDRDAPGAQVRDLLQRQQGAPGYFGRGSSLAMFARCQLAMQWRKWMR